MLQYLNKLDHELFVFLNGLHHPFWDKVMVTASDKYLWIPFYALLLGFLLYQFRRKSYLLLPAIALTIGAADSISSALLKPLVGRLRPCHDASLNQLIYLANGCGGSFGFVSSHAANSFGLAMLVSLILEPRYNWLKLLLFGWAALVSYSRIYLGAHFPGDVLGGALLGCLAAYVFGSLFRKLAGRKFPVKDESSESINS